MVLLEKGLPKYLYKYRCFEDDHIDALTRHTIYFSRGREFNDPFDACKDVPMILSDREYAVKFYQKRNPKSYADYLKRFGSKQATDDALFRTLQNSQHDHKDIINGVLQRLESSYILSLSTSATNHLLWSHYGGWHSGFCIRFKTQALIDSMNIECAGPVTYTDEPINLFKFMCDGQDDYVNEARRLVYRKSIAWEYEREYRLIHNRFANSLSADGSIACTYPKDCVDAIFFGIRTCEQKKRELFEIYENQVIYKEVRQKQASYELTVSTDRYQPT